MKDGKSIMMDHPNRSLVKDYHFSEEYPVFAAITGCFSSSGRLPSFDEVSHISDGYKALRAVSRRI